MILFPSSSSSLRKFEFCLIPLFSSPEYVRNDSKASGPLNGGVGIGAWTSAALSSHGAVLVACREISTAQLGLAVVQREAA